MKRLFKLKHPKLELLLFTIILAYFLFNNPFIKEMMTSFSSLGYISAFIAGIFFSFGFTTSFSVGFFVTNNFENLFLTALAGGIGSTISTLLLFKSFKFSFKDEIKDLEKKLHFKDFMKIVDKKIPCKIRLYIAYSFIGLILASPIPNEFATLMLAGMKKIKEKILALITLITATVGIYILLLLP